MLCQSEVQTGSGSGELLELLEKRQDAHNFISQIVLQIHSFAWIQRSDSGLLKTQNDTSNLNQRFKPHASVWQFGLLT